ncbi:MAG: hypothetical protein HKM28_06195 [Flavobacteriaceae bacterium]|nr:hypothetical protein [Flavobacteriaceae bacterium]
MKNVFSANSIRTEDKYKVLGDFIQFVSDNPEYEGELEQTVQYFSVEGNGLVYEKLGEYYITKGRKEDALKFYELGVEKDEDNFSLVKNTILLQIEFEKYPEAVVLSDSALEIFPAQPILYLLNGVANNKSNQHDNAIESLLTGVDYVFENPTMEKDFYKQLEIAYLAKNDPEKAKRYAQLAAQIQDPN